MKNNLNKEKIEKGLVIDETNAWSLSMQTNQYFSEKGICSIVSFLEYKRKK
jgi:hypothetical protein